jgi:hypothetical protein
MHYTAIWILLVRCGALSYQPRPLGFDTADYPPHSDLPQYMRGYFSNELGPNYVAIRLTIVFMIFSCIAFLGFMIIYGVGKFMSAPRRGRDKFATYVQQSYTWTQRGRAKECIHENGCSGGTIDSSKSNDTEDK